MLVRKFLLCLISAVLMLCGCSVNTAESAPNGGDRTEPLPDQPAAEGSRLTVYSFKAGKADAHLIYNSQSAVLIDCGEKGFGKEITEWLDSKGIKTIDLLIITHFDKDHVGGAARVIKDTEVKRVMQTNYVKDSKECENYFEALAEKQLTAETVRERTSVSVGGSEFTVCPPLREFYQDSPSNNASLITTVRCGKCSLLFTGDAEDARLGEFMNTEGGHYDYVKIPYHGHFQQRLAPFIKMCSPAVAVITSSDEEQEDPQVMKLLAEEGTAVYLTRQAPVTAECDGERVTAFYDE